MKKIEFDQTTAFRGGTDFETGVGAMCGLGIVGAVLSGGLGSALALSLCAHGLLFLIP